jgi:Xaa-Pro aminopeptidase
MTVTIGHTILAIPGFGGVRHEDVYRVTPAGGEILVPYPIAPVVAAAPPAPSTERILGPK